MIRSMVVPGWRRFIPGLVVCALFAFVVMNIDHLLHDYHQANVASQKLPALQEQLITLHGRHAPADEVGALEAKVAKLRQALFAVGGKVGESYAWATFLYEKCELTYVAMLLLGGILIRNTLGVAEILKPGIGIARGLIKPGIIILGVHYVVSDVLRVGGVGLALTTLFIFGTAITVMAVGRKLGVSDGLGGIMGAGCGVCGVSAIIAIAPVVKAKPRDLAYAIGTILLFGTLMLFVMPYLGHLLGVSQPQFGAWAALAVLNTAQLIAAAEWYGDQARDTAVLINAARIMLIPFIVMYTVWFYDLRSEQGEKAGFVRTLRDKFPVFILGFFALVVLNSIHLSGLGSPQETGTPFWAMDVVYKWFFAVGFAGIGLSISIDDMRKAGGTAFAIGSGAALAKATLGLAAVLAIGTALLQVTGGR